jgi:thiol-disulfide isomerase/thioredoxin
MQPLNPDDLNHNWHHVNCFPFKPQVCSHVDGCCPGHVSMGRALLMAAMFWLCASIALPSAAIEMQKLTPWTGSETPALALEDLQGTPHGLSDYRGKVVLVNFWATWCGPCVAEMPSLQKLRDRINEGAAANRLEILAVNMAESPAKVSEFVKRLGVSFPVLLDRDEDAKDAWKIRVVPATFVVGRDGKVVYSYFGDADWASDEMFKRVSAIAN